MATERELLTRFVEKFDKFEDAHGRGETWQSEELTQLLDETKAILADEATPESSNAQDKLPLKDILHILRNPWNWPEKTIREVRLAAADMLEEDSEWVLPALRAARQTMQQATWPKVCAAIEETILRLQRRHG